MSVAPPACSHKRIVIVGAATGIGAAGARALHATGWNLALLDNAADPLAEVAAETNSIAITVDASEPPALADCLEQAVQALGGLDAAWSNVGVQVNGAVGDTNVAELDRCWAINVRAHFVCAQTVLPHLAAAGGGSLLMTDNSTIAATKL